MINYYIVSCSGKNINIFINKILKLNIDILKIEYFKDEVLIYIKYEDIKKIKVLEPDNNTVKEFNCVIEPLLKKCFMLSKENQLLFKQRDMLLPRLMSGKLEV